MFKNDILTQNEVTHFKDLPESDISCITMWYELELANYRSMESGDDGSILPDDVIDKVAKANTLHTEPVHVLPEIRASPCQIHMKGTRGTGQNVFYSTNSHGKEIQSPRRWNLHPNPKHNASTAHQLDSSHVNINRNKSNLNVYIPEQFPAKKPELPKHMSSKDFVMTWLIHGSAPAGSNHFPDIVQAQKKVKNKLLSKKSQISE